MKGLKKLCVYLLILATVLTPLPKVNAAEKEQKPEDAKTGVVQVNTVFTDEGGTKHVVCGGTGFIVGNSEKTEYVITCNHIVNPSDEYKNAAYEFYEIPNTDGQWSKISLSTEVILEGDVVVSANLLNASSELDLAILQLSQPIYTRTPLTILTEKEYDVNKLPYAITDSVYALGFPDAISFDSETQYYSENQVTVTAGHIVNLTNLNGVQVIESDAAVDANNCGGPLVDEHGYVIGMSLLTKDGMYSCGVDSTKIAIVLDGLGIEYDKITDLPKEETVDDEDDKDDDDDKDKDKEKEKASIPTYMLIIMGIVVLLVVVLLVTVIVLMVSKKKPDDEEKELKKREKKKRKKEKEPSVLDRYMQQSLESESSKLSTIKYATGDSDATTLLNEDADQTTILSASFEKSIGGILIRKNNGEQITITKSLFTIGKDNAHADYVITDNKTISRQHVIIRFDSGVATVEDCNSTNGSWLNGNKLSGGTSVKLSTGDVIKLADEEFEFRYRETY